MSVRYRPAATVWLLEPFHASVKYRAPDCWAIVVIASEVQVSK